MSDELDRSSPDRREFLKILGIAGVSATLGTPAVALAQSTESDEKDAAKPKPQPASPPAEEPEISPDAKSMLEIVKRRYGQYLSDDQLQEVLEDLNWRVTAGAALRKVPFSNGDEPDFIHSA